MSRSRSGGFRRQPRVADQMTSELYACVDRALAAERAGDVHAALEWHRAVPMFRRGRHGSLMERLSLLGDDLPDWVWARWITYQALRCEDGETGRLMKETLHDVAHSLHSDLLAACYRDGGDPIRVAAQILGESWAFHQWAAHECGGVDAFVNEFAAGRLAEHADLVRAWVGAPMAGYQVGESLPDARLQVRPADGGPWLETLDLGARSCATTGWVIGRLVPSGVGGLLMFDMPPLGVPQQVALGIASSGDWWSTVNAAHRDGRLPASRLLREDYELATDVGEVALLRFGTEHRELSRVMQQLREGRDEVSPAAYRVLARALRGDVDAGDQAYVGAAVQNVKAYDDARRNLVRPDRADPWSEWAERVARPASGRLLSLADSAGAAA